MNKKWPTQCPTCGAQYKETDPSEPRNFKDLGREVVWLDCRNGHQSSVWVQSGEKADTHRLKTEFVFTTTSR